MSLSLWCTSTAPGPPTPNSELERELATPSTALNFLAALSVPDLKVYRFLDLGLTGSSVRQAGSGGYAIVEIGADNSTGRAVAVKRSRILSGAVPGRNSDVFRRHFDQLVLELRILGHRKFRKHAGIIDLLGICIGQVNEDPDLALVLEYSQLGSLRSFLLADGRNGHGTSFAVRIDLVGQVARALDALHQLKVCHGDVKTENVLVFPCVDGSWIAKVSDFGQAIIAPATADEDSPPRVDVPVGTPLLSAPEVRTGSAVRDEHFTVELAMLTDVFSFGLLAWEVLLRLGKRFFDIAWLGSDSSSAPADLETMVDFLNRLRPNELCSYALREVQDMSIHDDEQRHALAALFEGALQDDPSGRKPMVDLVVLINEKQSKDDAATHASQDLPVMARNMFPATFSGSDDEEDSWAPSFKTVSEVSSLGSLLDLFNGALAAWTSRNSLYDVRDSSIFLNGGIFDDIPDTLRKVVFADLHSLATREGISTPLRAHSAMALSECYTLGFGVNHDIAKVSHWLLQAAVGGMHKAALWYHRVCAALGEDPSPEASDLGGREVEEALSSVPTELYLLRRIQHHNTSAIERARKLLGSSPALESLSFLFRLSLFNEDLVDELPLLHLVSWLGDHVTVQDLLAKFVVGADSKSKLGFSAAHYACLGGSLTTLRILVQYGVPLSPAGSNDITPLHFCIFMPCQDLPDAVALILSAGALIHDGKPREFKWDDHDIRLGGSPVAWAITTRNRPMVQLLLPHCSECDPAWLFAAISHFFWEILEDLLLHFKGNLDTGSPLTRLHPVQRPFSHWIAHGSEHTRAIQRTVQVCIDHGLLEFDAERNGDNEPLETLITNARTHGDIDLIEAVTAAAPQEFIKRVPAGFARDSVLESALSMAGNKPIWCGILRRLAAMYTIEELERDRGFQGNILTAAIASGSLVGARVLLERGLDVNKPYQIVDGLEMTAIRDCIAVSGSAEMMALLVEFGANLLYKDAATGMTPLQWLTTGNLQTDAMLELLLKHEYDDSFLVDVLDLSLTTFISAELSQPAIRPPHSPGDVVDRRTHREHIRSLLTHPQFAKHVNSPCKGGYLLIHKAALMLHEEAICLLLEAGSDASIPLRVGQLQLLPLQLACAQGRILSLASGLHAAEYQQNASAARRRAQALPVAEELLRWHQARGDGLFKGIGTGHLACRMLILRQDGERSAGNDSVGTWPGVDEGVTPQDLIRLKVAEDEEVAAMMETITD